MSIMLTDLIIKTGLEFAISDMRKNRWIVEECFASAAEDPLLSATSGWKEIKKATDWFMNSEIQILQEWRMDKPVFPSISITQNGSSEMAERTFLGDGGYDIEDTKISPTVARRPIIKIVNNFAAIAYEMSTGVVKVPTSVDISDVLKGHYLVDSKNKSFEILDTGSQTIVISPNTKLDLNSICVVPRYCVYNLHKEYTVLNESFNLICGAASDVNITIWMHQLLMYILLRYKESLFEARGLELTTFSSGPLMKAGDFQTENIFIRQISFTCQTPITFVKYMAPPIEHVTVETKLVE